MDDDDAPTGSAARADRGGELFPPPQSLCGCQHDAPLAETPTLRPRGGRGPCRGAPRGSSGRRGCASAAGSRGSSRAGGCSAGRCACSRQAPSSCASRATCARKVVLGEAARATAGTPYLSPYQGQLNSRSRVRAGRDTVNARHYPPQTPQLCTAVERLWTTLLACPVAGLHGRTPDSAGQRGTHRATDEAFVRWGR